MSPVVFGTSRFLLFYVIKAYSYGLRAIVRIATGMNTARTRSYKQNFDVGYAGFCYAEILNKDFSVKNFGVAIFQGKLHRKSFIGSGPGLNLG